MPATVGSNRISKQQTVKQWQGREFEAARSFGGEERLEAIEARKQTLQLHNLLVALPVP